MAEIGTSKDTGERAAEGRPGARATDREIQRRRTFAIISHPDAGKTTLTEKLLLYGGAIHLAGTVKARRAARHATSDWMEMEKERGISVTTSVMQFEYEGYHVNLLDTPGHQDFSEDTYRTLLAADSAAMLLDNRKGVEGQTRKLFRVCRMRRLPIFTFVNKCDRVGADPLGLLDDIEADLGIRAHPVTWPVIDGADCVGVYDRRSDRIHLFERTGDHGQTRTDERSFPADDDAIRERVSETALERLGEELELLDGVAGDLDPEDVREERVTPTFFGSALHNFGVALFLEYFLSHAPAPGPREASGETIRPEDDEFAGFVFKIQANMDPKHRDRIAFVRICSGRYEPGMTVVNLRTDDDVRLASARQFLAQDRTQVESAVAGDVVGIHDRGSLRIGDTLATDGGPAFDDIPRFTPELFARPIVPDPLRRKHLDRGLRELSEEGAIQVLYPERPDAPNPWVAAVGSLQFDVLLHRLEHEYGVEARLEPLSYEHARWIVGPRDAVQRFAKGYLRKLAYDSGDRPVALFENDYALKKGLEEAEDQGVTLHEVSP